jgi:hypothetical protein
MSLPTTQTQILNSTSGPTEQTSLGVFTLAVLVDLDSEPVSREQAQVVVNEASQILKGLTGFTLEMIDFREVSNAANTNSIIADYINSNPIVIPNGFVIFSYGDDDFAKSRGGYAIAYTVPGFRNTFVSPQIAPGTLIGAVLHYSHRYAKCGYGDSDTMISSVSIDGECRNQAGIACVEKFDYLMCINAVNNLYASTRTYMTSSSLVHEIMHSFGLYGNQDHSSTTECNAEMAKGTSQRPYSSGDLDSSQFYCGMCPYIYDIFVNSYQP